jgi:hypothetical protein
VATEEHAIRKIMLPLCHRRLEPRHAMGLHIGADGGLVGSVRRPLRRQQQGVQFPIRRVGRQRAREILEVAVQVDVFLRDATQVREPVRVERMDVQHRDTVPGCVRMPFFVVQGVHLHPAAAIALDAMAGTGHHQQMPRIRRPGQRHIHGQGLAVPPRQRMQVRLDRQPSGGSSLQETDAGLRVARREGLPQIDHGAGLLSQAWASSTQ